MVQAPQEQQAIPAVSELQAPPDAGQIPYVGYFDIFDPSKGWWNVGRTPLAAAADLAALITNCAIFGWNRRLNPDVRAQRAQKRDQREQADRERIERDEALEKDLFREVAVGGGPDAADATFKELVREFKLAPFKFGKKDGDSSSSLCPHGEEFVRALTKEPGLFLSTIEPAAKEGRLATPRQLMLALAGGLEAGKRLVASSVEEELSHLLADRQTAARLRRELKSRYAPNYEAEIYRQLEQMFPPGVDIGELLERANLIEQLTGCSAEEERITSGRARRTFLPQVEPLSRLAGQEETVALIDSLNEHEVLKRLATDLDLLLNSQLESELRSVFNRLNEERLNQLKEPLQTIGYSIEDLRALISQAFLQRRNISDELKIRICQLIENLHSPSGRLKRAINSASNSLEETVFDEDGSFVPGNMPGHNLLDEQTQKLLGDQVLSRLDLSSLPSLKEEIDDRRRLLSTDEKRRQTFQAINELVEVVFSGLNEAGSRSRKPLESGRVALERLIALANNPDDQLKAALARSALAFLSKDADLGRALETMVSINAAAEKPAGGGRLNPYRTVTRRLGPLPLETANFRNYQPGLPEYLTPQTLAFLKLLGLMYPGSNDDALVPIPGLGLPRALMAGELEEMIQSGGTVLAELGSAKEIIVKALLTEFCHRAGQAGAEGVEQDLLQPEGMAVMAAVTSFDHAVTLDKKQRLLWAAACHNPKFASTVEALLENSRHYWSTRGGKEANEGCIALYLLACSAVVARRDDETSPAGKAYVRQAIIALSEAIHSLVAAKPPEIKGAKDKPEEGPQRDFDKDKGKLAAALLKALAKQLPMEDVAMLAEITTDSIVGAAEKQQQKGISVALQPDLTACYKAIGTRLAQDGKFAREFSWQLGRILWRLANAIAPQLGELVKEWIKKPEDNTNPLVGLLNLINALPPRTQSWGSDRLLFTVAGEPLVDKTTGLPETPVAEIVSRKLQFGGIEGLHLPGEQFGRSQEKEWFSPAIEHLGIEPKATLFAQDAALIIGQNLLQTALAEVMEVELTRQRLAQEAATLQDRTQALARTPTAQLTEQERRTRMAEIAELTQARTALSGRLNLSEQSKIGADLTSSYVKALLQRVSFDSAVIPHVDRRGSLEPENAIWAVKANNLPDISEELQSLLEWLGKNRAELNRLLPDEVLTELLSEFEPRSEGSLEAAAQELRARAYVTLI